MQKLTQKIAIPHVSGGAEGGGGCPTRRTAFCSSPSQGVRQLNAALAEAEELLDGEKAARASTGKSTDATPAMREADLSVDW